MCTLISAFPKYSTMMNASKPKQNLEMFLQECKDERTYYRVRLIGSSSSKRDDPHIIRHVHTAWSKEDPTTHKKHLDKIVCPSNTSWADTGDVPKKAACKVCGYVNQNWTIYRESGKTDTLARQQAGSFMSKFEAVVPVYVRSDPNYEKNNGRFRVIVFNDKDTYELLRKLANAKYNSGVSIFNGENAVDCLIHLTKESYEGKNGKTYYRTVIDKIKFSSEPYDIAAINTKSIDQFIKAFDDTYFTQSSPEEIDAFYNKYCAISNDDIPEDDDIQVYKPEAKRPATATKIPVNDAAPSNDIPDDDIDELIDEKPIKKSVTSAVDDDNALAEDPDNVDVAIPSPKKASNDVDLKSDDILAELGI